ncbi:hypothetical protein ACO1O0_007756 [Amphichorda felina]
MSITSPRPIFITQLATGTYTIISDHKTPHARPREITMQLVATLTVLFSAAAATEWTFYCGSSCDDGTVIAQGTEFEATDCLNFEAGTTSDYCWLESDDTIHKAVVYKHEGCVVADPGEPQSIHEGECLEKGDWKSYHVVLNL